MVIQSNHNSVISLAVVVFEEKQSTGLYRQWRKSGWNSGGRRCGSGRLDWGRKVGCGDGVPLPTRGMVWEGGLAPSPEKNCFT